MAKGAKKKSKPAAAGKLASVGWTGELMDWMYFRGFRLPEQEGMAARDLLQHLQEYSRGEAAPEMVSYNFKRKMVRFIIRRANKDRQQFGTDEEGESLWESLFGNESEEHRTGQTSKRMRTRSAKEVTAAVVERWNQSQMLAAGAASSGAGPRTSSLTPGTGNEVPEAAQGPDAVVAFGQVKELAMELKARYGERMRQAADTVSETAEDDGQEIVACKGCGAAQHSVKWRMNNGYVVGAVCYSCCKACSSLYLDCREFLEGYRQQGLGHVVQEVSELYRRARKSNDCTCAECVIGRA